MGTLKVGCPKQPSLFINLTVGEELSFLEAAIRFSIAPRGGSIKGVGMMVSYRGLFQVILDRGNVLPS